MGKTLRSIVDIGRNKMTFSQGDLRVPCESPQETFKSSLPKRQYITHQYFLESAQNYLNGLKVRVFEIISYIPKII